MKPSWPPGLLAIRGGAADRPNERPGALQRPPRFCSSSGLTRCFPVSRPCPGLHYRPGLRRTSAAAARISAGGLDRRRRPRICGACGGGRRSRRPLRRIARKSEGNGLFVSSSLLNNLWDPPGSECTIGPLVWGTKNLKRLGRDGVDVLVPVKAGSIRRRNRHPA